MARRPRRRATRAQLEHDLGVYRRQLAEEVNRRQLAEASRRRPRGSRKPVERRKRVRLRGPRRVLQRLSAGAGGGPVMLARRGIRPFRRKRRWKCVKWRKR